MAGGTKGRMTADVIIAPATADCSLVAGLGAWAEKCRTAVCVRVDVTTPARLILVVPVVVGCCREEVV